jgi:glutathione S-transferase
MLERAVKATVSGWRPWAIGAALSMAGAALLFFRWQRNALDTYEEWWQHREHVRANGHQPRSREGDRSGNSQLFV